MAGIKRLRLVVVAAVLLVAVYWLVRDADDDQIRPAPQADPNPKLNHGSIGGSKHVDGDASSNHNGAGRGGALAKPPLQEPSSPIGTPLTPTRLPELPNARVVKDAHTLPSADDFVSHLWAVTNLPGLGLREAKQTCTWKPDEKVNFQFDDAEDWVKADRPNAEIEARRAEWHAFVRGGMIPYSAVADRFTNPRGLVILAGNQDTVSRVGVILRALQKLGSKVAIEIHYFGDEMSEHDRMSLSSVWPRMFFNDLSGSHNIMTPKKDGLYINYQLKTAALVNSRFAEPLLLDSDNIPLIDPDTLYDSEVYREYGTVFWPDIARTWPQNPAWAITNTNCRMDEYEQESGQLLVDKTRFWYHLQLAAWWNNQHGDYYNKFLLGDKDMFRFAWHALKTEYGRPKKWLASVGTENDGFYCGHSFAQHHPDDHRVAFLHGGLVKTVSLEVMRWNKEVKGGYFRHYKRAPSDEDPSVNVHVGIKFDSATYKPNHLPDFHPAMCTDLYDVKARDFNELVPMWEKTMDEIRGYWQLVPDKAQSGNGFGGTD